MKLDRKVERDIQEAERDIHKRTSVSCTRLRQKNENKSRCIGLYNKRSVIYEMQE